ncbi:MAG: peptide deformylase [Candidatus Eisenbacteria bacterium]
MTVRPVRVYGDPVLRQRARELVEFDDSLRELVTDMEQTMHAYNGVGLAANQIGVAQRVLIVDVPVDETTRARHVLVNPVLSKREGQQEGEEGCLSIPGIYEDVKRAQSVHVSAMDENGGKVELTVEGYLARAIQHEVDHLDGVLFIDRISVLKRALLKRKLEDLARGDLPDDFPPVTARKGAI